MADETEYYPPPPDQNRSEFYNDSASREPNVLTPGNVLSGKFRLEKQLGRGGMGEAWKAFDIPAERYVVLKFVPREIQHFEEAMDSLRESFKKIHTLQHQHICPVYDLFKDKQCGFCLVMKFIDGFSLDNYKRKQIEKNGKMSFSDAAQILWGIAKGLDYAHEKKIIHRDIKPQNIMIGKKDGVQIIDFGLAEEIRTSMAKFSGTVMEVSGTRSYMAPEQWRGRLQDARTDQYALAVTAYELISGRRPFRGTDLVVLRESVLKDDPEPIPGLPEHVNVALAKALSKSREDRYADCKSFVKALVEKPKGEKSDDNTELSVVADLPLDPATDITPPPVWVPSISMEETSPFSVPNRAGKSWLLGFGCSSVFLLLLALLGFLFGFLSNKPPSQPNVAVAPETLEPEKSISVNVTTLPEGPITVEERALPPSLIQEEQLKKAQEKYKSIPDAKVKMTFNGVQRGHFTPDGMAFVASSIFSGWNTFDVATGKSLIGTGSPHWVSGTDTHPDNQMTAMATEVDKVNMIRLWNIRNGELFREIKTHGDWIDALRFAPDGSWIASGSRDGAVVIWDTETGEERMRFPGHTDAIRDVDISPDGKLLATGANDGSVRLWDVKTGKELHRLNEHTHHEICAITFNHQGTLLASGSCDCTVVFWDVKTGKPIKRLIGSESAIVGLDFSPDDSQLAVATHAAFHTSVWDVETAMPLYRLQTGNGSNVMATFSKDGKMIAVCSQPNKDATVFETPTPEELAQMEQDLKGKRETANEILLREMPPPEQAQVGHECWHWETFESSQGRHENSLWAHAPSKYVFDLDKHWKTFKTQYGLSRHVDMNVANAVFIVKGDGKELFRSEAVQDIVARPLELNVSGIAKLELIVDPNGNGTDDHAVWFTPMLLRDNVPAGPPIQAADDFASPGRTLEEIERLQKVRERLKMIPDAKKKIELSTDGGAWYELGQFTTDSKKYISLSRGKENASYVFDLETGKPTSKLVATHWLNDTDVHPDGKRAVTSMDGGNVMLWTIENGEVLQTIKAHNAFIETIRFSRDGSFFATVSKDTTAAVWDTATGEERMRFKGHNACVYGVAISPDGNLLATIAKNSEVRLWNIETGEMLHCIKTHPHDLATRGIAFNHQGTILAYASHPGAVVFCDTKTGRPIKRILGIDNDVIALGFSPDDSQLALGCRNGVYSSVWDVETGLPLYRLSTQDANYTALFSPDGKSIALGAESCAVIWEVPTPEESARREQELKTERETALEIPLRKMSVEYAVNGYGNWFWTTHDSASGRYENSLVSHAYSKFVFRLDKRWKTFKTGYGLEKNSNLDHANVICIVKGDGKELFRSEEIKDHTARPLELDVSDVDLLELIVDPNGSTYCDGAVWFTPTLSREDVRKPQEPTTLTDDEKRLLQQKYPELDWTGAKVVVLPEPSEDALRQAFEKAAETPDNDFIVVRTTKEKHKIVLNGGPFVIEHNAKNKGSVALISLGPEKLVLDGNKKDRIFDIQGEAKADFAGIAFTNGFVVDDRGGAVKARIRGRSPYLRFFHCDVIGNVCKVEKNFETWNGSGNGGGISAFFSNLVLRDVLFEGNRIDLPENKKSNWESSSAGLHVHGEQSVNMINVVFRKNDGGAMFINGPRSLQMNGVSVLDNQTFRGEAVHLRNNNNTDRAWQIANFFATGNTANSSKNGFTGTLLVSGKGLFHLDHLMIVDNSCAMQGSGLAISDSAGPKGIPTEVTLSNSIIAGNRRKGADKDSNFEIRGESKVEKLNIFNCITSDGPAEFAKDRNNLVIRRNDLKLGELQDFGNGVPVMPLLSGSPAVDTGTVTENMPKTDITGRPRNVGKAPDIGAFEWQENATSPPKETKPVEKSATPPVPLEAWQPSQRELASAPPEFRKQLMEVENQIKEKGGFAVAGQVVEKNGPPMKRGAFTVSVNRSDTYRYENGWFISRQIFDGKFNNFVAATFQHEEVEIPLAIETGKVHFQRGFVKRVPEEKLSTLQGVVRDEKNRPINGAQVSLILSRSSGYFGTQTTMQAVTDSSGCYSFSGIAVQPYSLRVSLPGYSSSICAVKPVNENGIWTCQTTFGGVSRLEDGKIVTTVPFQRKVVVDSIYQPDGTPNFTNVGFVKKRFTVQSGERYNWQEHFEGSSLRLSYSNGNLTFDKYYGSGNSGFYDAGEIAFDSLKEAVPAKCSGNYLPCKLNHVYVFRTHQKGHYAKFVVRSIEIMDRPSKGASR